MNIITKLYRGAVRLLFFTLFSLTLSPLANAATDDKGELVLGVFPYLSPNQIVEYFTPLKDHLAKSLGRQVEVRSAPNFAQFVERTRAGEYDVIFTGPHMGRLAEKRDSYRPLAQTGVPIITVALVKKDSPLKSLGNLQNGTVAVGSKLAMAYQNINLELRKSGLELGKNVKFLDTATFSNVVEAVIHGEADVGAVGSALWDSASAEQHAKLQEIYRSKPLPGFLLLGHTRNGKATLDKIQASLYDFSATPTGKAYFAKSGHIDFRPVDAATMKSMDPFTAVFDAP
jgi:phosphonate transport system substrate-binding protein